jgi:3-phosphoglycerate kinase
MGKALTDPARPFAALIGGAKISDKIGVMENILEKVDYLLVAGGMCATFFKALKYDVGASSVEEDKLDLAHRLMDRADKRGIKLMLPSDVVVGNRFSADAESKVVSASNIPAGWYIMDIGPQTLGTFVATLRECETIIWNGPVGVFEYAEFSKGTRDIANLLARLDATTIIGGGSTAEAVEEIGLADKMTHVSTGGGASLKFLEGKTLPGVAVLQDKEN